MLINFFDLLDILKNVSNTTRKESMFWFMRAKIMMKLWGWISHFLEVVLLEVHNDQLVSQGQSNIVRYILKNYKKNIVHQARIISVRSATQRHLVTKPKACSQIYNMLMKKRITYVCQGQHFIEIVFKKRILHKKKL